MIKSVSLIFVAALAFIPVQGQSPDFNIDVIYNWHDASLEVNRYEARYNEIWGMALKGREYGIIGSTHGTHIFDVTDPANITLAKYVPGEIQGYEVRHRDMHDYKGYLYIVGDEEPNALVIIDMNQLPAAAPEVYNSKALFEHAHNIFIDSVTGKMFTARTDKNPGIETFSLADPENPTRIPNGDLYLDPKSHDLYVRGDTAWINATRGGLVVADFSVTPPDIITEFTSYPDAGVNHSGWLSEDGKTYVMTDETPSSRVKILDVTDVQDIKVASMVHSGEQNLANGAIAHNVIIRGDYCFITFYHDGIIIWNISDPYNPVETGRYDTYLDWDDPDHESWMGAWGTYPLLPSGNSLVSDKHFGMFVLDVTQATPGMITKIPDKKNLIENDIKIAYSPDGFVNLNLDFKIESYTLEIFNTSGKLVTRKNDMSERYILVDGKKLGSGTYFATILSRNKIVANKQFVVQ